MSIREGVGIKFFICAMSSLTSLQSEYLGHLCGKVYAVGGLFNALRMICVSSLLFPFDVPLCDEAAESANILAANSHRFCEVCNYSISLINCKCYFDKLRLCFAYHLHSEKMSKAACCFEEVFVLMNLSIDDKHHFCSDVHSLFSSVDDVSVGLQIQTKKCSLFLVLQ